MSLFICQCCTYSVYYPYNSHAAASRIDERRPRLLSRAMRLADFDFTLPRELIADHPCEPREAARLLHIPVAGAPADQHVADLPDLLRAGDLLVCNDTKVIPARL